VVFWKQVEFRPSGRRFDRMAAALARLPGVRRVVVTTPPFRRAEFDPRLRLAKALPLWAEKRPDGYTSLGMVLPSTILGVGWSEAVDSRLLEFGISLFFRSQRSAPRLLWLCPDQPWAARLERSVDYDVLVSDCVDEMPAPLSPGHASFSRLVAMSDAVFTTSPETAQALGALNRRCRFLPNAVDASLLVDPARVRCGQSTPPRVGFVGVISARTDIALLGAIADALPRAQLIVVGWVDNDRLVEFRALLNKPNVVFVDRVPFGQVPAHIDSFDVCIIPHRDHPLTRSQSALKLYQYLARGKPVVTTPVNGVTEMAGAVHVARSPVEFVAMVSNLVDRGAGDHDAVVQRVSVAAAHTWDIRAREAWDHLTAIP
jgi:glycosyltransferase involved in cell wall biosynthesis